MSNFTISINGESRELASTVNQRLKQLYSYNLSEVAHDKFHNISLSADHVMKLRFVDGTEWFCNADTLDELFPQVLASKRRTDEAFVLPGGISGMPAGRAEPGVIDLQSVDVYLRSGNPQDIQELARNLDAKLLPKGPGLFRIDKNSNLHFFQPSLSGKPYLLLLHGPLSCGATSFRNLLDAATWAGISEAHEALLSFEHATLHKSPLENVKDLFELLPVGATINILSHSRGGLLAEIISRFCASEGVRGFDDAEKKLLEKEIKVIVL